ncbi:MAG: response regulator [Oscillospiraceae bacterium]|nr:response regulator [Oscillospiraceae bacterium]
MYKLVIVDDEKDVRERLVHMLEKCAAGFSLVGQYENGIDAYEGVLAEDPDVVITDIKIPYIDGIELARKIREVDPLVRVIVITGFDEFDYAKQAANLGVVGFISKPVTQEELQAVLARARAALDEQYVTANNLSSLEAYYEDTLPVIRETDLYRLSNMTDVTPEFEKKLRYNDIDLGYGRFAVCIFDFDEIASELPAEKYELVYSAIRKFVPESVGAICAPEIFNRYEKLCVILKSNEPIDLSALEKTIGLIIQRVDRFSDVPLSAGISAVHTDRNFKRMCGEALRALEYRGIMGGRKVFAYGSIPGGSGELAPVEDSTVRELGYLLKFKSEREFLAALASIRETLRAGETAGAYYYTLTGILGTLIRSCEDLEGLYELYGSHNDMYRRLFELKTLDEIFAYFEEIAQAVRRLNDARIVGNVEQNLEKVVAWMRAHYTDTDLSFESMAASVNFSVSYISALLKKNLNTTFVKYTTSLRMERAKELLSDASLKIIDVAEQLGYSDPYYFSHCFKKYTGISPKEFKAHG